MREFRKLDSRVQVLMEAPLYAEQPGQETLQEEAQELCDV